MHKTNSAKYQYSVKGGDRWNKVYHPRFREHGQWIVTDEPFKRRDEAEAKGKELQAEADMRAKEETANILAELNAPAIELAD